MSLNGFVAKKVERREGTGEIISISGKGFIKILMVQGEIEADKIDIIVDGVTIKASDLAVSEDSYSHCDLAKIENITFQHEFKIKQVERRSWNKIKGVVLYRLAT